MFSDTFAGIAPASAPVFILAQLIGGVIAIGAIRTLYPDITPSEAAEIMVPHQADPSTSAGATPEQAVR